MGGGDASLLIGGIVCRARCTTSAHRIAPPHSGHAPSEGTSGRTVPSLLLSLVTTRLARHLRWDTMLHSAHVPHSSSGDNLPSQSRHVVHVGNQGLAMAPRTKFQQLTTSESSSPLFQFSAFRRRAAKASVALNTSAIASAATPANLVGAVKGRILKFLKEF